MNIGDKVSALDEDFEGIVVSIKNDVVMVESDGFEMEFNKSELILMPDTSIQNKIFKNTSAKSVIAEKEAPEKPFLKSKKTNKRYIPPMEVDLHAHQITKSTRYMTKHDVLNLQLDTAKHKIEFAMRKNIQRIVFIHGVGEGVLKMELEYLFSKYDNLKYYDADYKKYGYGATEVYVFQNG